MKKQFPVDFEENVVINGSKQNIRVRAAKEGLPVILFLHGGPGVCDRHVVMKYQSELAKDFTLVCWDQRGSGKSFYKGITDEKLTLDTYVEDAKALVDLLCEKFCTEKIIVAGHSWGTIVGIPLVSKYPEKIAAYVGQGQFVEGAQNEKLSYDFCLEEAKRRGDKKALSKLEGKAPVDGKYPDEKAMMAQRDCLSKYGGSNYKNRGGMIKSLLIPLIKSPEYKLSDIPKYAKGGLYLSKVLWDDAVEQNYFFVKNLDMPVIITQGRHDFNTPSALAQKWFDSLETPFKKWIWFEESAHSPIAEEPEKWTNEVRTALFEALA